MKCLRLVSLLFWGAELLIWGGFGFRDALLLQVPLLLAQLLALKVVTFPVQVQVPDGFPLGAAPLGLT